MARRNKTQPAVRKSSRVRKVEAIATAEPEQEQTDGGAESTVIATTTFCLVLALALLIMATGRYS